MLHFAGAKLGLFHLSADGQVKRYAGARASLGYQQPPDEEDAPLTHSIAWRDGDVFAVVTDGFTDQVGGDGTPRSFGYRRLEALLSASTGHAADHIVERMREEFARWQGGHARRDDVTAVVFCP